jgi:hypothetical protein
MGSENRQHLGWGRLRRVAFFVWAAILSLLFGLTFVGVTALTIGLWLLDQNHDTNPVVDLGFFALGGVIIAIGFVVQLWAPERKIAGVQQAAIGLLALGIAGLIGGRIEPLAGSLVGLVATVVLVALHPARRAFFRLGAHPSLRLAMLSMLAAIPAIIYATAMLIQARQAGPSCFFGRCAYGDRLAEMASLAVTLVAGGLLAASKPEGWRITAWSVGVAAIIPGAASIVLPAFPGAVGQAAGAVGVIWGVLFIAIAVWEAHRGEQLLQLVRFGPRGWAATGKQFLTLRSLLVIMVFHPGRGAGDDDRAQPPR